MTTYSYTEGGSVSSSAFEAAYYDEDMNTLYLVFTNGRVAAYVVLSSTYEAFRDADSIGRFYNQYIYSHSAGVSVDQGCTFQKKVDLQTPAPMVQDVTKAVEVTVDKVQPKFYEFKVYYTVSSDECDIVTAASIDDAISQVQGEYGDPEHLNIVKVEVEFD